MYQGRLSIRSTILWTNTPLQAINFVRKIHKGHSILEHPLVLLPSEDTKQLSYQYSCPACIRNDFGKGFDC